MEIKKVALACCFSLFSVAGIAASETEKSCEKKINQLEKLVKQAQKKNLDTNREECALYMAELFLGFADWDEKNVELNIYQYETWPPFKPNAEQLANELPEFERQEVEKMLDASIAEITAVIVGEIVRREVPEIDYTSLKLADNGQFVSNGRPVYFNHFGRVPKGTANEYTGMMDGSSLNLRQLANMDGELTKQTIESVVNKKSGNAGFVFLGHNLPQWALDIDPEATIGRRYFVPCDIDNPLVRELWAKTAETVVPYLKGHNSSALGYMLLNEPHWFTQKDTWATGEVSKYTLAKLRVWLTNKHKEIARLNELWGTNYASFDEVYVEFPFDKAYIGQPIGYDLQKFNQDRVTEWFAFLNKIIKEQDPEAKTHIKVMPDLFTNEKRDHGLDFEQLTLMSDIIGNDGKTTGRRFFDKYPKAWETHYCFEWEDVGLAYDFMESVKPNMANINSEAHFLSTVHFRDIRLTKEYTRAAYWIAILQGMTISDTWFWPRDEEGGIVKYLRAGTSHTDQAMVASYVASVIQQPRVANEVAQTFIDVNAFALEMEQLQSLPRPLRIFYSETTAINDMEYMHAIAELYEPIFFEGNAVGFATENIINTRANNPFDVVLIKNTPFVTDSEFAAVQRYLDEGGTVIIDNKSLKLNEYGEARSEKLQPSNGTIYSPAYLDGFIAKGLEVLKAKGSAPLLAISETNTTGHKGCVWRMIPAIENDGSYVVNIVNIGKGAADITIRNSNGSPITTVTDMFTGKKLDSKLTVASQEVLMLRVGK